VIRSTDHLFAPSRVTAAQAIAGLEAAVQSIDDKDRQFLTELVKACDEAGIDAAIAVSHCGNETDLFRDANWNTRLNPAGIGITGEPGVLGPVFPSARAAARFYVALLLLKLRRGGDIGAFEAERATAPAAFDGTRSFARDPTFPVVTTLDDLRRRFGPNDRECVWMCDQSGPLAIAAKARILFPALPDQGEEPPPVTTGHVPKPPMIVRHVTGTVNVNRYPDDPSRPGSIVGSCFHTSQGTYQGNDSVFHDPNWGGLTDYQVGGPGDGAFDGVIEEFIDPNSGIVPFANGEWNASRAFGDGPRFVQRFGVYDINQRLRSIEHPDRGDPLTPLTPKQFESSAFLTAWIHAEQAGQTAETFDWQMAHAEFGASHQQCPGPRYFDRVDEYQARVRAIMHAYQTNTRLDSPLVITYPPGWTGGVIPQPGEGTDTTTTTAPPVNYPAKRVPILQAGSVAYDGVPAVTVTANDHNRFRCIHGTTIRTYPHRDAPAGVKRRTGRNRRYTFQWQATVDGETWFASKAGSWALASAFEPL
jgi:hypothetical protein